MTDTACVEDFVLARDEYHVNPLFIHSIYLINLASAEQSARPTKKSGWV